MGILQRFVARGELKAMRQFEQQMHELAPGIPVQLVQVPCHIIDEPHTALGATVGGESVGIYRCQGRFWAAPLTQHELWQTTMGARTFDPASAARTMSGQRQDLGPLMPNGTMGLVAAAGEIRSSPAPAPPPQQQPPSPGVQYQPSSPPAATQQSDAEAEQAYWDGFVDWYERGFPLTREGQFTAAFGATARSEELDWAPVLFDASDEHGVELFRGESLFVVLRADDTRTPAMWTISLREDRHIVEREYEHAGTELGAWLVAPVN